MSAQHTPGPWHVDPENPTWVDDENECCMATTGYGDDEGDRANARLIAAAPDMLAALRQVVDETAGGMVPPSTDAIDTARAAIAKAEGA